MDESGIDVPMKKPNSVWEFFKAVIISILIVIPVRAYVAQPFIVDGASMEPNFHGGDYLIVDELSYELREPARNEVIVFRYPLNPTQFFIKRIIGLPGETVTIKSNIVSITTTDGKTSALEEAYLPTSFYTGPDMTVVVPPDQYFVLGDNRGHSSDSRVWGLLPRKNMMGRALVRLWPVTDISLISN